MINSHNLALLAPINILQMQFYFPHVCPLIMILERSSEAKWQIDMNIMWQLCLDNQMMQDLCLCNEWALYITILSVLKVSLFYMLSFEVCLKRPTFFGTRVVHSVQYSCSMYCLLSKLNSGMQAYSCNFNCKG